MEVKRVIPFVFIFFLMVYSLPAQIVDMPYEHISTKQGLNSSTVNCILMDRMGFIWIGTIGGLFRYDGYELKEYKCNLQDQNSFSHPYIQDLYEDPGDSCHIFWVGTSGGGLNRLNVETGEFKHYRFISDTSNCLSNDVIHTLSPDDSGNIWIGTWGGGINIFNIKTEKFRYLKHNLDDANSPGNDIIMVMIQDRMGLFWIGTEGAGLDCFDPVKKRFRHFINDSNKPESLSDNNVWSLYQDRQGDLWIGTKNGLNYLSLSIYKTKDDLFAAGNPRFYRFMHDPDDPGSIGENWIIGISEDKFNRLWVGSYGGGLCMYQPDTKTFVSFKYHPSDKTLTASNDLKPVYADPRGQALWVGTDGGGVYKHPLHQKKFNHIGHQADHPNSLSSNAVFGILEDSRKELWIANSSRGLDRFNPVTGKFMHYDYEQLNPFSLSSGKIHLMKEDRDGAIWIATAHGVTKYERKRDRFIRYSSDTYKGNIQFPEWIHGLVIDSLSSPPVLWLGGFDGLFKFDYMNNRIWRYIHDESDPKSLVNNNVMFIYGEYDQGNLILWIATEGGLSKFDTKQNTFNNFLNKTYAAGSGGKYPYPCYCVYRDQAGRLWIGTFGSGIACMDEVSDNFKFYSEKNGLVNNYVNTIEEDNHQNLWIGTIGGLSCFNPQSGQFRNYDMNDDLLCSEFWNWSSLRAKDGTLYFGGNNGIVYFHPDSIRENITVPPVVLTDFQIFNQSVDPGINSPLAKTITEAEEIILPHDQDIFTIKFSALDYTAPMKNQYAYKLGGINEDWVYTDATRRFATYTKLDPGEYIFWVKGSNNDEVWNEDGTSIKIIISPPWYRSRIAYTFYILALIGLIVGTWKWQVTRLKNKHQRELEHMETEKIKEIDQAKSRFFANISHEFRTPLTLIEGPIKQVLNGEFTGNIKDHCQMILRNTSRLLDLVNQLLDISRLESGRMKLQVKKQDIIAMLRDLAQSFESLAKRKNIQFIFETAEEILEGYMDEEKLERIINNLLSNAFKFTPEGGKVEVVLTPLFPPLCIRGDRGVSITISNTGPGIHPDKIDHIFNRFYQVDDSRTRNHEGTGIGLALVKEMVELHHGQVTATSKPGKITTFTVIILVGSGSYDELEICTDETSVGVGVGAIHELPQHESPLPDSSPLPIPPKHPPKTAPVILIVDDNADVRKYIGGLLHSDYRIIEAENGEAGLTASKEKMPDLVISDVMMPGMDGYEFCKKVKTDIQISHIPIVLLTARASEEDRLEGLELGADDYITKPFEARELQLRVKNMISHRRHMQEKFNQDIFSTIKELAITSLDQKFMEKLLQIVNRQISSPDLNVEKLSHEIGISRTHFERKVKALFGLTPLAFIRLIRLRRAKELLENNFGNVTQVAFEVGFSNISYFSICYHRQFGTHPSAHLPKSLR